jgi:hypothetical protein
MYGVLYINWRETFLYRGSKPFCTVCVCEVRYRFVHQEVHMYVSYSHLLTFSSYFISVYNATEL